VSSPFLRCVETDEALAEGAGSGAALELLRDAEDPLAACVHGDLVEDLLGAKLKKGATAILDVTADGVELLEHLEPPA
jgi:hypothetical protein